MISDVLVVIDLQNGVNSVDYPLVHLESVLAGVNQRIASYRDAGKSVIFVQHVDEKLVIGSDAWALMPDMDSR